MHRPQTQSLENAFTAAESACAGLYDEDEGRVALLMTIWASGYLEVTCRETLLHYARERSAPAVARYVRSQLHWFQNPNMERIAELIGRFDKDKAAELRDWAEGPVAESVNSIRGLRNQIAHGQLPDVSVAWIVGHFRNARLLSNRLARLMA